MFRKSLFFFAGLFFTVSSCYGYSLLETERFAFSIDTYFRTDLVSFKNVVDLDSGNSDDTTTYLGIDYNLGFRCASKDNGPEFYLKLERNGPGDYDAPLFVHNTLMNTGGVIEKYRNDELLPQVEEFWLSLPLKQNFRYKLGLYAYEVGNGFSLNGSFENYGLTVSYELENFNWRLYYCRPEIVYKNHLGPRIRQEEEQGYDYNHNASNFFATDVKFNIGKNTLWPYVGVLADYTSPEKRDNVFTAPIERDILGTFGLAWNLKQDKLSLALEAARNFGKAESSDSDSDSEYKDIYHTGYLVYTELKYSLGKLTPSLQLLLCSGNKVSLDAAGDDTLASGKNRAFSSYSPLNNNLGDTISACNSEARPIVLMGSGCGLNYGIPRPGTLASSDFDNLLMPSLGLDLEMTDKLSLSFDGYYIRSFERGVGTFGEEVKYLPKDLGYETDLLIDYRLNKHTLISFLGGYFFPAGFYKEERDDTSGSLLSPFVRGDGKVDSAYQVELSLELQF
jgi:hypothetical protein